MNRKWFERLQHGWDSLGRFRPWVVFILAFLVFAVLQFRHRDLPPYWDGTVNFRGSFAIQENGFLPFLREGDTGHPPTWSWLLAVLSRAGIPPLLGFHLISWICIATLLTGIWRLGRLTGSGAIGLLAAILVGLNPCVAGQSLQFNLDLPMAAFGILAMALFSEGRFWSAGFAAAVMALSKLNGLFGMAPFWILCVLLLLRDPRFRTRSILLRLGWVSFFPPLMTGVYLAVKYAVLGRVFDSGEYEGGNQVAIADTFPRYVDLVIHSLYQMLSNNGMWYLFIGCLAIAVVRWSLRSHRGPLPPDPPTEPGRLSLDRSWVFIFLVLMAVTQVLLQSIRNIPTIPRYFMIGYPALAIPLSWGIWTSFPRRRWIAIAIALLLFGGIQIAKWTPRYWIEWHRGLYPLVTNPSPDVSSNHEWSLGFVETLRNTRTLAKTLEHYIQPGQTVGGDWPFTVYLTDSRFGMVHKSYPIGFVGFPWWEHPGNADYIIVYDWHPYHQPFPSGFRGNEGFRLLKSRTGPVGSVALYWRTPDP